MKKLSFNILLFLFFLPVFSFSQQSLDLASCVIEEYEVNDRFDTDNDGEVCETKLVLTNSASYFNDEICQLSNIQWTVFVDLDADGTIDLEYSSSLPMNDMTLDDTNGNGIPDQYIPTTVNNEEQSIPLPDIVGSSSNHDITWTVSDDCNLGDNCNTSFSIQDKRAPTPYCLSSSSIVFDGIPFEVTAYDFDLGSFDNCSESSGLRFSFSGESIVSSRLLSCEDVMNSPIELRMYVWDEFDNVDYCTFFLNVIAGPNSDCYESSVISGTVTDWKGNPIEGAEVTLDANAPEYPRTAITDEDGKYFYNEQPSGLTFRLSVDFDESFLTGSSTLDLVLIVRHILGIESFMNPYQIIASDINGDNKITAFDILTLRKLILGVVTDVPTNKPWRFLRADYEFSDPLKPFQSIEDSLEDPYAYIFNNIDSTEYDFIGVKTGNIN